jgi:transposase-like protein
VANFTAFILSVGHGLKRRVFKMTMTDIKCKLCGSNNVIKRGIVNGVQRYWCNDCQHKFTDKDTLFKMKTPVNQIGTALGEYYDGLSQNRVRFQLKRIYNADVSDYAVYNWLERFTKDAIKITDAYKPNTGYVWLCDETAVKVGGKNCWLLDCIDIKTRFLLATRLSPYRRVEDIEALLKDAYNRSGILPKVIMTDHLHAYVHAVPQVFGDKAKHLQVKKFTARPNNNIIERMQGTIKARLKTMRGLKTLDTARTLIDGFIVNYNYFRPHETLSQIELTTPAQKAGIKFPYHSWEELIKYSQEAKNQILTKPSIPELKQLPVSEAEQKRIFFRQQQRDLLEGVRKHNERKGIRKYSRGKKHQTTRARPRANPPSLRSIKL